VNAPGDCHLTVARGKVSLNIIAMDPGDPKLPAVRIVLVSSMILAIRPGSSDSCSNHGGESGIAEFPLFPVVILRLSPP